MVLRYELKAGRSLPADVKSSVILRNLPRAILTHFRLDAECKGYTCQQLISPITAYMQLGRNTADVLPKAPPLPPPHPGTGPAPMEVDALSGSKGKGMKGMKPMSISKWQIDEVTKKVKEVSAEWGRCHFLTDLWMLKIDDVTNEKYSSLYKSSFDHLAIQRFTLTPRQNTLSNPRAVAGCNHCFGYFIRLQTVAILAQGEKDDANRVSISHYAIHEEVVEHGIQPDGQIPIDNDICEVDKSSIIGTNAFFLDKILEEENEVLANEHDYQTLKLDGILTHVDAKHVIQHPGEEKPEGVDKEAVEPITFVDCMLLNKCEVVDEVHLAETEKRMCMIIEPVQMKSTINSDVYSAGDGVIHNRSVSHLDCWHKSSSIITIVITFNVSLITLSNCGQGCSQGIPSPK